uniref:GH16 domain-containing protein n=1 Tax=Bionectria ochroleuca TaxID=29856 RepID=A0A8H7NIN3_BIOOC
MLLIAQLIILFCTSAFGHSHPLANCDLSNGAHYCSPSLGLARNFSFDFVCAFKDADLNTYWTKDQTSSQDQRLINLDTNGKGAALGIWEPGHAPSLSTQHYVFFGKVSVELLAASGHEVASSIVLKSDSGNEISWDILGMYDNQVQASYLFHGDTNGKVYNQTFPVDSSIFTAFHTYSIEWTQRPPEKWPQTPMKLHIGTWIPDQDREGNSLARWAGGPSSWERAPFTAFFRKVEINDFAGLCLEVDGPVEYVFDEGIRGWEDVKVKGCYKRFSSGMYIPHAGFQVPTSRPVEAPSASSGGSSLFSSGVVRPTDTGKTTGSVPERTNAEAEGEAVSVPWPRTHRLVAVLFLVWLLLSW